MHQMRFLCVLVLVCVFCLLSCAKSPDNSRIYIDATDDFGTPFQINIDNHVRRQPPAIAVQPQGRLSHRPRAVFIPFRMTQNINGANSFSHVLSRQFWNVFLSLSIFNTLEFVETAVPYKPDMALAIARRKGAELAVGGYIHHYFDGGTGGTSSLSITLEIYEAKTGVLLWSLASGGMLEARQSHDFYLFAINERNPGDPAGLIARSLAWDMGQLLLKWVNSSAAYDPDKNKKSSILKGSGY